MFFAITIMLRRSLAESAGHFWQPAEFENVANPDFENLKHLQNPGYLSQTTPSILSICDLILLLIFYYIYMYIIIPLNNRM